MPDNFDPILIKNFYSHDLVELAQKQLDAIKTTQLSETDNAEFNRFYYHDHPFFVALHELQQKRVQKILNRELRRSYCFASMYFAGTGKCPKHTDRPQCKYTVDVCFNQKEPWPFFVESPQLHKFSMEPGDAIILSGTEHPHWREPIQSGNFCDLVFFHYVDPDFTGSLT